jgi:hypothetical protein
LRHLSCHWKRTQLVKSRRRGMYGQCTTLFPGQCFRRLTTSTARSGPLFTTWRLGDLAVVQESLDAGSVDSCHDPAAQNIGSTTPPFCTDALNPAFWLYANSRTGLSVARRAAWPSLIFLPAETASCDPCLFLHHSSFLCPSRRLLSSVCASSVLDRALDSRLTC